MSRKLFSYYGGSEFHNKMLKIFAGMSLLQGGFFYLASYQIISHVEAIGSKSRLPADHTFYTEMKEQQTFLYLIVTLAILISTTLFVYLGMKFSHEAVGAIYRMKKDLETMTANGKVETLNLRKNDYFKDIENAFNDFITKVKSNHKINK
jgi:methyl-accepting chemotaxis protein